MAKNPCWTCKQPATHVFTREGSNTLHACDNCTRIDRAEAKSRGWTITPLAASSPRTLRSAEYFNGYVTSDGRYEVKASYGLSLRGGSVSRPTSWTLIDRQGEFKPSERPLLSDIRDILKERP